MARSARPTLPGKEACPTCPIHPTRPYKHLWFICFYRKLNTVSNPRGANQNPNLSTP